MSDLKFNSSQRVWNSEGYNLNNAQPYLIAKRNGNLSNVTGAGANYTVPYNDVLYEVGSGLNTSTGVYTFPTTGKYIVEFSVHIYGLTASHSICASRFVSTSVTWQVGDINTAIVRTAGGNYIIEGTLLTSNNSGDTGRVEIAVSNGTSTVDIFGIAGFTWLFIGLIA